MSRPRRIVGCLLVLAATAACSVPRGGNSAVTDVAGCAAVLPLARNAVHGHGQLVLVHSLGRRDADELYAELGAPPLPPPTPPPGGGPPPPPPAADPLPKTCIVVYRGDYAVGSVTGADAGASASGHYALVVARVRHPVVYRVLLTAELPKDLPGT